ncbi:hypothetical protein GUITHDRAFT_101632 [Guillardia theta CCMP2712]|uniref:Uncharacterized protein n=1 Tax=Guillardia theta (strain CCMP2712) TaxID=905079 RepID=L1JW78_GUITC|nr:hypothetical protein GUITHDRAFT_101632 [Guillardia theta CCMP2712]EKX52460.1 hypothetical protein GUITHDRAFT_101632 [Guillardia theta CCMP2712]|mmetsp:Transcript_50730/g.158492  ORF Transcript_50730/g.158492 Transcript_50730/m.158492 type:complete len:250 (-) Transcript_50730:191-940(-)|eukprot:XP_005839440.1 hypothetical protein GUITHDRAFT_101632 [Guillardia theta CCMP2712]
MEPLEAILHTLFRPKWERDPNDSEYDGIKEMREVCSEKLTVSFCHSWPTPITIEKDAYFEHLEAMAEAFPDWSYRAKVWRSSSGQAQEEEGKDGRVVLSLVMDPCGTHTGVLKLFGEVVPATGKKLTFPKELVHVHFDKSGGAPLVHHIEFSKVIDMQANNTGDLAGVPGLLFALSRPIPPPASHILSTVPPYTAADNRDPNFKLRIQVFKQICRRVDADKLQLRQLITDQKVELQRHLDYLNAIRNYC